ncbi:MAG: hypothetical protein ACXABY_28640, partial [Candidatus Thorarchaeota archaeon]
MPVEYPRDCEIWEDIDTGTTFLVPVDVSQHILKAKKKRNIQQIAEFTAQTRLHMMETFYLLTGRGEYKPPEKNRSFDSKKGSSTSSSTSSTGKKYVPKPSALEVIRNALNTYGAEQFRRKRKSPFASHSNENPT